MAAHASRETTLLSVLKILVWAVIAVAMVKFAFFPSSNASDGATPNPSADYGQITVTAQRGTVSSSLSLEATIETDPATPVKATLDGKVSRIYIEDGSRASKGDAILQIAREAPADDASSDGDAATTKTQYENVRAPVDGLVSLNAITGQQFSVGDSIGSVQPSSYSVAGNLTADQMYRVQQAPSSASIAIKNGPAPFQCQGLKIVTNQSTSSGDDASKNSGEDSGSGSAGNSSSTIQARCAVPSDQTVFPGLQATMEIVVGEAEDVLTLPVTAVEGRFQTGYVYVPTDDPDKPKKTKVTLGLTDGDLIEIKEGIDEDQEVLEFVPGQDDSGQECDPALGEDC